MEPDPKKGEEWILLFCDDCGLGGCGGECSAGRGDGAQAYQSTPAAPSRPPPPQPQLQANPKGGGGGGEGGSRRAGEGGAARRRLFKDEPSAGTSFGRRCCPQCDKTFPSSAKLSHHLLSHTGERPFSCTTCPKSFSSKFKLMRHSLIHSNKRQYECAVCNRSFLRKDHLVNHTKVHSPAKVSFKCDRPGCTKEYSTHLSLRKHRAHHSAVEGDTQCKICNRCFETKEEIFLHLKVHAGSRTLKGPADKKYQCERCGLRFFTRKDVRRHLVVHTGRRDFLCQYCPQRFGRKDHLVRHVNKSHMRAPSPPSTSYPVRTNRKQRSALDVVQEFVQSQELSSPPPQQGSTPLPTFSQAFPPPPS